MNYPPESLEWRPAIPVGRRRKVGDGMRIYVISRSLGGIVRCMVKHVNGGNPTMPPPYRLPHANLHSPTGFECGYGGSGPADLAASILADFLGVKSRTVAAAYHGKPRRRPPLALKVLLLHEHFKADVIAGLLIGPGGSFEIAGDEIAKWLAEHPHESEKAASA